MKGGYSKYTLFHTSSDRILPFIYRLFQLPDIIVEKLQKYLTVYLPFIIYRLLPLVIFKQVYKSFVAVQHCR